MKWIVGSCCCLRCGYLLNEESKSGTEPKSKKDGRIVNIPASIVNRTNLYVFIFRDVFVYSQHAETLIFTERRPFYFRRLSTTTTNKPFNFQQKWKEKKTDNLLLYLFCNIFLFVDVLRKAQKRFWVMIEVDKNENNRWVSVETWMAYLSA